MGEHFLKNCLKDTCEKADMLIFLVWATSTKSDPTEITLFLAREINFGKRCLRKSLRYIFTTLNILLLFA